MSLSASFNPRQEPWLGWEQGSLMQGQLVLGTDVYLLDLFFLQILSSSHIDSKAGKNFHTFEIEFARSVASGHPC